MPNINFTTYKGTKYILSFDQLGNPENIEVSFRTKDQGYKATNKGEAFEVMQIITEKVKQFLEKFKEKYPKKINDFETATMFCETSTEFKISSSDTAIKVELSI